VITVSRFPDAVFAGIFTEIPKSRKGVPARRPAWIPLQDSDTDFRAHMIYDQCRVVIRISWGAHMLFHRTRVSPTWLKGRLRDRREEMFINYTVIAFQGAAKTKSLRCRCDVYSNSVGLDSRSRPRNRWLFS
jgi:hypothetical protein